MKTLQVQGQGKFCASPNAVEINMVSEDKHREYQKAVKEESQKRAELIAALCNVGAKEDDIKCGNYNVYREEESVRNPDGGYSRKQGDYRCSVNSTYRFALSDSKLAQVLNAINSSGSDISFNVRFLYANKQEAMDVLLSSAVEDACQKANILAKASKVQLGDIQNIEYDFADIALYSHTRYAPMANMVGADSGKITPEDVNLNVSVKVVWEIK